MKKFVSLTLAVLMVLSLLSGCGGSSMAKDAAAPAARQEMAVEAPMMMASGSMTNDMAGEAGQSVPNTEQKLIKTIRMEAETEDLDALLPQINTKISALVRARGLEKMLDTPAHIYFKNESVSPVGSHKLNSAIPQAYYNKKQGVTNITTETGAGQWGAALSLAAKHFGLELSDYRSSGNRW